MAGAAHRVRRQRILVLGASPPDPLPARSRPSTRLRAPRAFVEERGPAIPTPLAWLTRFRSFALGPGLRPQTPYTLARALRPGSGRPEHLSRGGDPMISPPPCAP